MKPALLDTDILSELLKQKNARVVARAAEYLREFGLFAFSSITRYEILRGLIEKNAVRQLTRFESFCKNSLIVPLDDRVFDRAAQLWVAGRQAGESHRDADLLIAATALEHGRDLVTGNRSHFEWITGLEVDDWRST